MVRHCPIDRHLHAMTGIALEDASVAESVVRRAAAGDESACVRLVEDHHAPMVRAAYVITGDADLAGEATQLAWTKAWRRLGTIRDPHRVRAWLVAIAVNEARQLTRRQRRRAAHEILLSPDDGAADPAGRIEVVDLRRAVARLPARDQDLLAMRFAAGLDSTEIGAQAGISAAGVRSRLARLLERLRTELDDA
jgi:RNA polymerase sigma-70 factor, ECF subfamily